MRSIPLSTLPKRTRRRLLYALAALAVVTALGTVGFHLIEGWSLVDSLYFTVVTVATVGYGDLHPAGGVGRLFAVFFIIVSVGTVGYVVSSAIQGLVQSEVLAVLGRRRRNREMSRLSDHFIICGAGRVGARVIRELQRARAPFVVIEHDPQRSQALAEEGTRVINRDATLEETLRDAGVERARALGACLPDDALNVYVVLTARGLNPALHIVARAVEEQAEPKLIRAGANRVIAPTIIGSQRMLQAMTKPAVADFIDSITANELDLDFEEVEVAPDSAYAGRKLRFTNIRAELDVVIVAVRRRNGEMLFNPTGDAHIQAGDLLIAIGRPDSLARLKEQAGRAK